MTVFYNIYIRAIAVALFLMYLLGSDAARAQRADRWVDSLMQAMTPDERLGQLFMVDVSSKWTPADKAFQKIERCIDSCHIGGVIFFYGGPCRQANLCNRLQQRSRVPLMVAIDGEWGLTMRLDSVPSFPRNLTLGAVSDNGLIHDLGREIGRECRRLGVNIDFMPCVDLYNNIANPVIVNRSFGSNKLNVAYKGMSIVEGMMRSGVMTTAKHFPGHGNTETDSHEALPVIRDSYAKMDTMDMFPFKYMVRKGVPGVMVGHLLIPSIVGASCKTPASISDKVINGVLKDSLGFQGLVFTDALQMKGVCKDYKPGEVELMAFRAGVDVFLMPQNCETSFRYMRDARDNGLISQEEIDRKCAKILAAKHQMGLHKYQSIRTENLTKDLNSNRAAKLNRRLCENAVTLVKNDSSLLPLRDLGEKRIAVVSVSKDGLGNEFEATFCKFTNPDIFRISKTAGAADFQRLKHQIQDYDLVVLGLMTANAYPSTFGTPDAVVDLVEYLLDKGNVVLDVFNSPVSITRLRNPGKARAIVVSYEDNAVMHEVSARMILGTLPFVGRLPVGVGIFKEGEGLVTKTLMKQ